ncbi:MAG TPA: DUF2933 domain-containing protein [Longimicrobiales bacterium]
MTPEYQHPHEKHGSGGRSRWVFWAFLAIAGFFLITEHRAHVFQYWPFLLLAACPLLHLFHGHGGHGGHGGHEKDKEARKDQTS